MSFRPSRLPHLLLALTLFALAPRASSGQQCVGDCNGDGSVTVNELVTLVNVALGAQAADVCLPGDANADGTIAINEIVSAVNVALTGCPLPSGDPAAIGLAVARALAQLPALSDIFAGALNGIGADEMCTFGGSLSSTCEDLGTGMFVNETTADHCRLETADGIVESTGSATSTASGLCPNQFLPNGLRIAFAADALLQTSDGAPLINARVDATVTLQNLIAGTSHCSVGGGVVTVDGPIVYTMPDGHSATVTFDDTTVTFQFVGTDAQCRNVVTAIASGGARIEDTYGDGPLGFSVTLNDLAVTEDRVAHSIAIAGEIISDCLGSHAQLETIEPLAYPLGQACFAGGRLDIGLSSGTVQALVGTDGSVQVNRGGDSLPDSYASCLDLPRAVCE